MNGDKFKPMQEEGVEMSKLSRADIEKLASEFEVNFCDQNLKDLDLSNLEMAEADFSQSDVRGARFQRAHLPNTRWSDARFPDQAEGVSFEAADLSEAVFESTLLNLSTVDFSEADLSNSRFRRVFFGDMDYYDAIFAGTTLKGVHIDESDLSGLDLSQAGDISGIQIINPDYIAGMRIREDQASHILQGLRITRDDSGALKDIKAILESSRAGSATAAQICEKLGLEVLY